MTTLQRTHQAADDPQNGLWHFRFDPSTHPELVGYAVPLINFAAYLKFSEELGDLASIRKQAIQMLSCYRQSLSALPIKEKDVSIAHYVLCAVIDDAVLGRPWSVRASWAEYGLAAHFHQDANGGERFFEILRSNLAARTPNNSLLLLLYYCISICFEGRLRLSESRIQEKQLYLDRIYQALLPDYGDKLHVIGIGSDQFQVKSHKQHVKTLPILATFFLCINLVLGMLYYLLLSPIREDVTHQISALTLYQLPSGVTGKSDPGIMPKQVAHVLPRLAELLAQEIQNGDLVLLKTETGIPFIRILKDPLFASASDQLDTNSIALINRIAAAIVIISREVTVIGYADSQPMHSRQFPSNHFLSQARAKTIAELLRAVMPGIVINAEGKGNTEPIATNITRKGRSLNRRVEIYLTLKTDRAS